MFLHVMSDEEKGKFLEMVYKIANIDGKFADEEQEIINSYKSETGVSVIPDTDNIDGLISYFSGTSDTLKKIILFEIVGLINAEDKIEKEEKLILDKLTEKFGLSEGNIEKIKSVAEKLKEVYDEIFDVLFD